MTEKSIIIENQTLTYGLQSGIYYSQLTYTPLDDFPFTIYIDNVVSDDPTTYTRIGKTVTWVGTPSGTIVARYSRVSTEATGLAEINLDSAGGNGSIIASIAGTPITTGTGISINAGVISNTASFTLSNDQVKADNIDAKAVTNQAIDDFAVNTEELANLSVEEAKIANDAVKFSKIQNLSQHRVIGRTASGTGDPSEVTVQTALSATTDQLAYADAIKSYIDTEIQNYKPRFIALKGWSAAASSTGANWKANTLTGDTTDIIIRNNHGTANYSDGSSSTASQRPSVTFQLSSFLSPVETNFYTKIIYLHGRCTFRTTVPTSKDARLRMMWRASHYRGGNSSDFDMHMISGLEFTRQDNGGTNILNQLFGSAFILPITPYMITNNTITFNFDKIGTGGSASDHSFIHLFGATLAGQ